MWYITVGVRLIFHFVLQADWAEEGILLLFLFVFISRSLVFIARAMCALLNVTVAALCISSVQQQCDQSSVRRCSWKRSVVFSRAPVYPQSRDLNQIQFIIATLYIMCSGLAYRFSFSVIRQLTVGFANTINSFFTFLKGALWYTFVARTNKMHTFLH